jgi:hypothetical protein
VAAAYVFDSVADKAYEHSVLPAISGMAPKAKLVSMKTLDPNGHGRVSDIIRALRAIQEMNVDGHALRIHGVMIGLAFDYDTERFECGLSPLCVEVDRLVRSGVVVVCAAGNRGFGRQNTVMRENAPSGLEVSIEDPGNAELAITVGSTHRDLPKLYGVSYYSSKGPTVDGRNKPISWRRVRESSQAARAERSRGRARRCPVAPTWRTPAVRVPPRTPQEPSRRFFQYVAISLDGPTS